MDHRITQCPRCGTSFRVTEAHLAVAAGAVRCGSCLHIFNAREHWVDAAPPAAEPPEKPLSAERIEELDINDDALFDDDTPLFDDEPEPATKTRSGAIFNPADEDFEVFDNSETEEFSDSFLEVNSWEEDSGHSFRYEGDSDEDAGDEPSEREWTQRLLEEDDTETAAALNAPARSSVIDDLDNILETVPEVDETEEDSAAVSTAGAELSEEFLTLTADHETAPNKPETSDAALSPTDDEFVFESMRAEPGDRETTDTPLFALRDLEQEPLQLHQFVQQSRWPKILWRIGLVAVLALSGWQYIYFNFDNLAHGPLRPWLERACNVFDCTLPQRFDIAQIHTDSLIVRSLPTRADALAVDAVITNQANFPQPYPMLQLQFSDLDGKPVAGRRFSPSEYLHGELTGARLMPVQQPIHISLELVDPGPRAVNYLLTVVAPPSAR